LAGGAFPPPPPAKPQTPSTPPQLNVRPVTQFAPDLSGSRGTLWQAFTTKGLLIFQLISPLTSLLLADKEENQSTALGTTTSEGMTGGAKAGVAIGVIFGVGVIAALIPLDFSSSCG
jgi:hypothetical protein